MESVSTYIIFPATRQELILAFLNEKIKWKWKIEKKERTKK